MNYLISGASGFIGSAIISNLVSSNIVVTTLDHFDDKSVVSKDVHLGIIENKLFCAPDSMQHIDTVIHCAGISSATNVSDFTDINYQLTIDLARVSAASGVSRFVFISSVKVNGTFTDLSPFNESSTPSPKDEYSFSKFYAEKELLVIAEKSDMEVVIIRPPLVYGPGVKGNFLFMSNFIRKVRLLPFASVKNMRSLIAIDNLVDFILLCADPKQSPKAANEIFLLSDCHDISVPDLLLKLAQAYKIKLFLFPFPVKWMKLIAKFLGKEDKLHPLISNLQIDSSKAKNLLGWRPVISMDGQLQKMIKS